LGVRVVPRAAMAPPTMPKIARTDRRPMVNPYGQPFLATERK
jgi:hypothetical protein